MGERAAELGGEFRVQHTRATQRYPSFLRSPAPSTTTVPAAGGGLGVTAKPPRLVASPTPALLFLQLVAAAALPQAAPLASPAEPAPAATATSSAAPATAPTMNGPQ